MSYTLGQAAKATGKNKSTIQRAIKAGRLSASFVDNEYQIDPAELHRVFPMLQQQDTQQSQRNNEQPVELPLATAEELASLRAENRLLREMTEDLRNERDRLLKVVDEQAGTVRLLTHQAVPGPRRGRNWMTWALMAILSVILAYVVVMQFWLVWLEAPSEPKPTPPEHSHPGHWELEDST